MEAWLRQNTGLEEKWTKLCAFDTFRKSSSNQGNGVSVSLPTSGVSVVSDRGAGRVFMFLIDDLAYLTLASAVARQMEKTARVVIVASAPVNAGSWKSLSESLSRFIEQIGLRQVSFVGMGAGATLVQNLALSRPKLVRTLVCIDASSRPHPTRWERAVDRIEENLPFGLPLRLGNDGFNIKSYVHRLRAPLLVVGTARASAFVIREMECVSRLAPTAWNVRICESDAEREAVALTGTLLAFYDTPAKCPQKNLGAVA